MNLETHSLSQNPKIRPSRPWGARESNSLARTTALLAGLVVGTALAGAQTIDVPADASLQQAFGQVVDGGVIRIAQGIYTPPPGGFLINDAQKSFTVRAAPGAQVVLDGGNTATPPSCGAGARPILTLRNSSLDLTHDIVFEDLIFRDGCGSAGGGGVIESAGGVTVSGARASFVDCRFEANGKPSGSGSAGGGAALLRDGSQVSFDSCVFEDNFAYNQGGALSAIAGSTVEVIASQFLDNRTNHPGHTTDSNGGAVALRASSLDAQRTRFQGNEAGVLGGAIFALAFGGDAPVSLDNCTFYDNHALNDPSVTPAFGRSGGAVYIEDLSSGFDASLDVYGSRFDENTAQAGGAIATFQSALSISQSSFRGNQVFGNSPGLGTGGAISVVSGNPRRGVDDVTASLTVTDSLFWCRYGGTGTAARAGGAVIARGGVPTPVDLTRIALVDCDVSGPASGALELTDANATLQDAIVINNDAPSGTGGAVRTFDGSLDVTRTTFAGNTAGGRGGALHLRGQNVSVWQSQFFDNSSGSDQGAALASEPEQSLDLTGTVSSSFFVDDADLPIWEADASASPINDLRYDGNTLFNQNVVAGRIFSNPLVGELDTSQLNATTIVRASAPNTDKSQVDNVAPGAAPSLGALLAVPSVVQEEGAAGDVAGPTQAYLAGAWTGSSATLDGAPLIPTRGLLTTDRGLHVLVVDGLTFTALVDSVPLFTDGFESGDLLAWSASTP